MKKELEQYCQNSIFWTRSFGELSHLKVVCFSDMASTKLSDQCYNDRKENFSDARVRIITAAANLIKNEIKCLRYETTVYPSKTDTEFAPNC